MTVYHVSWDGYGGASSDEYETELEALAEFRRGVQEGVPVSVWEKGLDVPPRLIATFPGVI